MRYANLGHCFPSSLARTRKSSKPFGTAASKLLSETELNFEFLMRRQLLSSQMYYNIFKYVEIVEFFSVMSKHILLLYTFSSRSGRIGCAVAYDISAFFQQETHNTINVVALYCSQKSWGCCIGLIWFKKVYSFIFPLHNHLFLQNRKLSWESQYWQWICDSKEWFQMFGKVLRGSFLLKRSMETLSISHHRKP